jgi:hypothetical protein
MYKKAKSTYSFCNESFFFQVELTYKGYAGLKED